MSKNRDQVKKAINELKNDIYYEKLGQIMYKLRSWLTNKDKVITQYIVEKCFYFIQEATHIENKCSLYTDSVVYFMQQIQQTLSRVCNQESISKKKSVIKPWDSSSQGQKYFQKCQQTWHTKRQQMRKISIISQNMIVTVKRNVEQNYKLFNQLKNQGKKLKMATEKLGAQYMKKFQITSVKNNQKHFQIVKIKELSCVFSEQVRLYEEMYALYLETLRKLLQNKSNLLESIHSNITSISQIMNLCFKGFSDQMESQSLRFVIDFKTVMSQIQISIVQNQVNRKRFIQNLKVNLQQISRGALEQISVTSWSIQSKSPQQKKFSFRKGIVTIDNKFLVLNDSNKSIESQINLAQTIVDDTDNLGQIILKSKKKSIKQKITIKFQTQQNQDEFKLHVLKAKSQIQ